MNDPKDEHWKKLCKQATGEQDSQKLVRLVAEISRLLEAKQNTNGEKKHISEAWRIN